MTTATPIAAKIDAYSKAAIARQEIIRINAGRRLAGRSSEQLPVPPKPERPMSVQLEDANGDYAGTWAYGITRETAIEEAVAAGSVGPFKVKMVPATR
jgi:hypothetical protein